MNDMTDEQIKTWLISFGVNGRFNGDVEFMNLVYKGTKTDSDIDRMVSLLENSGVYVDFNLWEKIDIPKRKAPRDLRERCKAAFRALQRHQARKMILARISQAKAFATRH